ncbi:2OG-Fe dioxygenase family protein [Chromobacterium sp. CV08]|uniref:2OG-Fe dioxygenase family protein n=1 Tax=Chromobacterium sp. CV08 TaxID=3133274 RepID=UPI003DA80856
MSHSTLKSKIFNLGLDVQELGEKGYQFLPGSDWPVPASIARCWGAFARSWSDLPLDPYLKDGATFRQRRIGRFVYRDINGHIDPTSSTQFFQSKSINGYAGGFERVFAPLHDLTYHNKLLHYIIANSLEHFCAAFGVRSDRWDITLHQFRISASGDAVGLPTPEGIHRDGHQFISMHLVGRENIGGGVSSVYADDGEKLAELTLEQPLDSLFVADYLLKHGVTPIHAIDPDKPAYRDLLVIDYNFLND